MVLKHVSVVRALARRFHHRPGEAGARMEVREELFKFVFLNEGILARNAMKMPFNWWEFSLVARGWSHLTTPEMKEWGEKVVFPELNEMREWAAGKPFKDVIDYGIALYKACKTPPNQIWLGDFTRVQREWIEAAKVL